MSLKSILKGWFGEKCAQVGMWLKLDDEIYKQFNDIILETETGTTQIDHVILSRFGVFVIETKNYNGWIYGGEKQKNWTQNLFGKKHIFQNPLHQNYKHTMALAKRLQINHDKLLPIIFFIGDAELKSNFPPNVMNKGLSAYIKTFNKVLFSEMELERLNALMDQLKKEKMISTSMHVKNLRGRYSDLTKCPKCGSLLVERTIKNGPKAGAKFLGCSSFPKCKYIKN